MVCPGCEKEVPELYVGPDGERCFDCQTPEEIAKYPKWAEREAAKRKHAELARRNFRKNQIEDSLRDLIRRGVAG